MKITNVIFGLLFGLIFTGAGVFIALETVVPTFQSWQAMQNWQSTTATLLSVRGEDNDTLARYRYVIAGKTYENDRVYVSTSKDNIGSYHKNKYKELSQLKKDQQPVTIWYSKADPTQAVIDRDMRWGLFTLMAVFCSVFIFIGVLVTYALLTSKDKGKEKKPSLNDLRKEWEEKSVNPLYKETFLEFANRRQHATDIKKTTSANAWLEKKEWRTKYIRSEARSSMWGAWFFAFIWNAGSSPVLFFLDDEISKGNYAALIALLFPLIGLYLIKLAWNKTREWRRYGVIELEMDPFPGSIGGHVGGVLRLNNVDAHDAKYKISLECVYTYVSGSGDDRSCKENIRWFESGYAQVVPTIEGIDLHFQFDVPDDLPEADIEQSGDYYFWRLKINADMPGIDLAREYNIPVFQTGVQSRHVRHSISEQLEQLKKEEVEELQSKFAQGDVLDTALARSLRFNQQGNGTCFYFPMFRNKVLTLFALIFGAGFSFATYMINQFFDDGGIISIVLLVFSIPFALIGLAGSIAAIYLPFNTLSVSLAGGKAKVVRSLFFIPIKRNIVDIDDIKNMEVKSYGSTGQGASRIKHFKIIVHTKNNKEITIAEDIDGKELAEQFKAFILNRLNMRY